ncbi:MAG: CYTH domain-containing protein, partial [Actinomycetes bacterium]
MNDANEQENGAGADDSASEGAPVTIERPTTVREEEIKLAVHGLFRLPDLVAHDVGVARAKRQIARRLDAVYYDTADLRLFRWGATLRRREGGHDAGWHLKLPVDGATKNVRDELQLPLSAGDRGEVPRELAAIVTPFTRGAPLRQAAHLQTDRTPYL